MFQFIVILDGDKCNKYGYASALIKYSKPVTVKKGAEHALRFLNNEL